MRGKKKEKEKSSALLVCMKRFTKPVLKAAVMFYSCLGCLMRIQVKKAKKTDVSPFLGW